MADFNTAYAYLKPDEGGYSSDSGGTMWGITSSVAQAAGYTGAMQDLPEQTAISIYQSSYWDNLGLGTLSSQGPATAIFDIGVNLGQGGLGPVVQTALAQVGWAGTQDGVWGPDTLAGVEAADPDSFVVAFSQAASQNYQSIVQNDASKAPNLTGWLNRANRLLTLQSGITGTVAAVTSTIQDTINNVVSEIQQNPESAILIAVTAAAALILLVVE